MNIKIKNAILELVKRANVKSVSVSCSENFEIEKLICSKTSLLVIGSDVCFYGTVLGCYFAKKSMPEFKFRKEVDERLDFINYFLSEDIDKVASIILLKTILPYTKYKNDYGNRMINNYKNEFSTLHKKMKEEIKTNSIHLNDFIIADIYSALDKIPDDSLFVNYLPFSKNANDILDTIFLGEKENYRKSNAKKETEHLLDKLFELNKIFIIISGSEIIKYGKSLNAKIQTSSSCYYIYTNITGNKSYISNKCPKQKLISLPLPKISKEDKIGEITIRMLSTEQFDELRLVYLSKKIKELAPSNIRFGLFSGGKLFGAFGFTSDYIKRIPNEIEKPSIYLMTDLAVSPTCETRLSKLVLYCILSREVKLLAERFFSKEVKTIYTNVFTDKNSSVKYRGVFDLFKKQVIEQDSPLNNLGYTATMGKFSLKEACEKWRQKSLK